LVQTAFKHNQNTLQLHGIESSVYGCLNFTGTVNPTGFYVSFFCSWGHDSQFFYLDVMYTLITIILEKKFGHCFMQHSISVLTLNVPTNSWMPTVSFIQYIAFNTFSKKGIVSLKPLV